MEGCEVAVVQGGVVAGLPGGELGKVYGERMTRARGRSRAKKVEPETEELISRWVRDYSAQSGVVMFA